MREVVFPEFIDNIVCDDFFSLILDLSRVVSLLFTLRGSHLLSQQIFLTNSNS